MAGAVRLERHRREDRDPDEPEEHADDDERDPAAGDRRADLQPVRASASAEQACGERGVPHAEAQGPHHGQPGGSELVDQPQGEPAGRHAPPVDPGQADFGGHLALRSVHGGDRLAGLLCGGVLHGVLTFLAGK
ncbi:hypothetical protein IHE61_01080 [Streptomyces sp. GKU 257-1]|nr:hypothetical protein [Streptomyces sp. GKU 257-1]